MHRIQIIDTHTGGEPTRVVVGGGPDLGSGSMTERRTLFSKQFDAWRRAIVCEPRGSDVMVGALITAPERDDSLAGVIFFNNVGYLGMCGHGTIGVAIALAHAGKIHAGRHALDTPAGQVHFDLLDAGQVRITNVPSYRYRTNVSVRLSSGQSVTGDVAWGGNWFYLCEPTGIELNVKSVRELTQLAEAIKAQLKQDNITGYGGAEIDHVELFGPADAKDGDSQNFVLCPGDAYDRSPCGTGTSAKVACLAASGKLQPGQLWRQLSILRSRFDATYDLIPEPHPESGCSQVRVHLVGSAYVNAEADLILDPNDPFCMGIQQ